MGSLQYQEFAHFCLLSNTGCKVHSSHNKTPLQPQHMASRIALSCFRRRLCLMYVSYPLAGVGRSQVQDKLPFASQGPPQLRGALTSCHLQLGLHSPPQEKFGSSPRPSCLSAKRHRCTATSRKGTWCSQNHVTRQAGAGVCSRAGRPFPSH